ncbi:MAG: AAA family ATPase [Lachnospiraceae bacterium]
MNYKMPFRCRLQKMRIENLKNVACGNIRFACNTYSDIFRDEADILGVYGQNGSGKTTLMFAIDLLKQLLCGKNIWRDMCKFIKVGASYAKIDYDISLESEKYGNYLISYSVTFKIKSRDTESMDMDVLGEEKQFTESEVYIAEEKLQYKRVNGEKGNRYNAIIEYKYDSENEASFGPEVRYKEFVGSEKKLVDELRYLKNSVYKSGSSFIFSIVRIKDIREKQGFSDELVFIMDSIQMFGVAKLFVLSNVQASIVNANILLPMSFCWLDEDRKNLKTMNMSIKLTDETNVPQEAYELIASRFKVIDTVITKIIPNMSLKVANRGTRVDEKGQPSVIIELISVRNGNEISLRYESDGIKKLVYILYSLIEMYNDPSVTVAIDELDSGVFEYLLGEILTVLQESAKGQLIFTSHNLRALEVLDKKSVMFSTTNENNRYIRFKNVKGTNNLRDMYYQDILLGGQDECIYEATSQSSIRRAFRRAGGDLNG